MKSDFLKCKQLCMPYKYHHNDDTMVDNKEELISTLNDYIYKHSDKLSKEMRAWAYKYLDELPQTIVQWIQGDMETINSILNDRIATNNRIVFLIRNSDQFESLFMYNNNYYDIIRYGLSHVDIKVRKMSLHLLDQSINYIGDTSICLEKFECSKELKEDWESYCVMGDVLIEPQSHLWKQIAPSFLVMWNKYERNPAMIKWLIALLNRGLVNGSSTVRMNVLSFILSTTIGSKLYKLDHRFLFKELLLYIDDSKLYTLQGVGHICSEFGDLLATFICKLITSSNDPYAMFKELLLHSEQLNSHLSLFFYISGILFAIESTESLWNEKVFLKLLKLFKNHYFVSRACREPVF